MTQKNLNEMTKEEKIAEVKKFISDEGIGLDDLKEIQTHQSEVTEEPALRPTDLEGATNIVSMTTEQLTSELAELKRRFNNLVATHHPDQF